MKIKYTYRNCFSNISEPPPSFSIAFTIIEPIITIKTIIKQILLPGNFKICPRQWTGFTVLIKNARVHFKASIYCDNWSGPGNIKTKEVKKEKENCYLKC